MPAQLFSVWLDLRRRYLGNNMKENTWRITQLLPGSAGLLLAAFFMTSCGELGGVLEKKAQTNGGSETGGAGGAGIVPPNPADIALPPGYNAEVVATGFTFPTGV